jgi:DNA-binding response OmpR family regulator
MSSKKILVVEDDADVRLGYRILLRANRYDTCFAADAASVLTVARKELPDLILLDLGLPGGDGFVVLERLANNMNLTHIPVIVVSARDHLNNAARALKAGARAYVQKPWDDDELLALIRQELDEVDHPESDPGRREKPVFRP